MLGDGKCMPVDFYEDLDLDLHCEQDVPVTLTNVAVVPGLAFYIMSFNRMQERHETILNRAGASMLGGRVRFKKFRAGNFVLETRVPHDDARPQPPATAAAMMRPDPPSSMNVNDLHISLGHTNDTIARETAKQMGMKVTDTREYCDGCGEAKVGRTLQRVLLDTTGPYPPSRAPFSWEVPTWGGGAVMDTAAAAVAPAAATVTGSGVSPSASARGAEGAPASAAVAASTVAGCGVFHAASVREAAGAPAPAGVAAASAAATATAAAGAAAAAAISPDGARDTAAARRGVFSTPPVDRTTARHDQHPETATTRRRPRTAGGFGF